VQASNLSTATDDLIATCGNTAKNVIQAYRVGGDRIVDFLEQRWDSTFKESGSQFVAEVQRNALNVQKIFGSSCIKGVAVTTEGAEFVVNKLVNWVAEGAQQVTANASYFEEKTGVNVLDHLALATLPAAVVTTELLTQLEQKSGELVSKIVGDSVTASTVKRATPFKQARQACKKA